MEGLIKERKQLVMKREVGERSNLFAFLVISHLLPVPRNERVIWKLIDALKKKLSIETLLEQTQSVNLEKNDYANQGSSQKVNIFESLAFLYCYERVPTQNNMSLVSLQVEKI